MNPHLDRLQSYPFERLAALLADVQAPAGVVPISLGIGEPKHATPAGLLAALRDVLPTLAQYPATAATPELRAAIAAWATRRFALGADALDPERHVLPTLGSREALFAIAQVVVDRNAHRPRVAMPNPFYQIYEGAALLAGAEPLYLPLRDDHGLPDYAAVPASVWNDVQLLYLNSPGNPTGAVHDAETLRTLIELSERYGFVLASDECYSEIYLDEAAPPPGLLGVAWAMGRCDFRNMIVFHSLSKRSNAPGLRSGFVAGDAQLLAAFRRYRTYQGTAMPPPLQAASIWAWSDEAHVVENRHRYRAKFAAVLEVLAPVLEVTPPQASFYLWPRTPIADEAFAKRLYAEAGVTVLPGSYLGREVGGVNPGAGRVRISLVAEQDACVVAAERIRTVVESLRISAADTM